MSTPAPQESSPRERRSAPLAFAVLFIALMFSFLAGYAALKGSALHRWYLFQVARSTAHCLEWSGVHAVLEEGRFHVEDVAGVRSVLAERAGAGTLTPAAQSTLTAWEYWQFRASEQQRVAPQVECGPEVTVSLRDRPAPAGLPPFTFSVISECGAIEMIAVFAAAVLAFSAAWRHKMLGLLPGFCILYGMNIARLACLGLIGLWDRGGSWFTFVHEYVWQSVYVVLVVGLWLFWAGLASGETGTRAGWREVFMRSRAGKIAVFCAKFSVIAPALAVLWWCLLPVYGWVLLQIVGAPLHFLARLPVEAGSVRVAGILNTGSLVAFQIAGEWSHFPIALLTANLPPYAALVLATQGLPLRRRALHLLLGGGLLIVGHAVLLFWAVLLRRGQIDQGLAVMEPPAVYTVTLQFFLTLPFLLWLLFPYRDPARRSVRAAGVEAGEA